jgi:hypothetical protein
MGQHKGVISEENFNDWFELAMKRALLDNNEQPVITADQIHASWQAVRARMELENAKKAIYSLR